jgi:hypothetical protein
MTTIAWINQQTNICENTSLDDRPASEIQVAGYLMLDLDAIGGGGIGDIWDGEKLVTPKPTEPFEPEPIEPTEES